MKKAVFVVLFFGLVACAAFAKVPEQRVRFSLHAGYLIMPWSEVNVWQVTVNGRAGFRLARGFELSPEITYGIGNGWEGRSTFYLGVIGNFMTRHFFAGVGFVAPFQGGGTDSIGPKVNIGLILGRFMATVYFAAAKMERINDDPIPILGASLGYRF